MGQPAEVMTCHCLSGTCGVCRGPGRGQGASVLGKRGLESGRGGLGKGQQFQTILSFCVKVFFPLPNTVTLRPRPPSYSWKAGGVPGSRALTSPCKYMQWACTAQHCRDRGLQGAATQGSKEVRARATGAWCPLTAHLWVAPGMAHQPCQPFSGSYDQGEFWVHVAPGLGSRAWG